MLIPLQLIHSENTARRMRRVRAHKRDKRALRLIVQRAIRSHLLPQFGRNNIRCGRESCRREELRSGGKGRNTQQVAHGRFADGEERRVFVCFAAVEQEDYTEAFAAGAPGSACAVHEGCWVGWRVELDGEVDLGDVEAAGGEVGG